METEELIECWPGEIATLSDGTRSTVGIDRPWQKALNQEVDIVVVTCPFCTEEQPGADRTLVVKVFNRGKAGKWKIRKNRMTPFPFHHLILPLECYDNETLWTLGGERKIAGALHTARSAMRGYGGSNIEDAFFFVHIGYSAGPRWKHENWHLIEPPRKPTLMESDLIELAERENLVVFRNLGFTVVAGGCRAGQCYIIPRRGEMEMFPDRQANTLATTIHRLVTLFNQKFTSAQGLKPDFQVFVRFMNRRLVYAKYTPILNMWGGSEYAAIDEMTPFVLPWPHEATVRHLLS